MGDVERGPVVVRDGTEAAVEALTATEPPGARVARRIFARQQAGESVLLVAWLDGVPVGSGELVLGERPELRSLHVRPGLRGRGVGTALVTAAERHAAPSGSLSMSVGVENPDARRLYERLGYQRTGELTTTTYTYVDESGEHEATETDERLVKVLGQGRGGADPHRESHGAAGASSAPVSQA